MSIVFYVSIFLLGCLLGGLAGILVAEYEIRQKIIIQ